MHQESLLLNLAICLTAALCCGWIAPRFHFSPIVGYLVAGIICGPFTPGWVANPDIAEELADIRQGNELKLLTADVGYLLVAAAMISITLNPFLFRNLHHIERQLRKLPQWRNA